MTTTLTCTGVGVTCTRLDTCTCRLHSFNCSRSPTAPTSYAVPCKCYLHARPFHLTARAPGPAWASMGSSSSKPTPAQAEQLRDPAQVHQAIDRAAAAIAQADVLLLARPDPPWSSAFWSVQAHTCA